MTVIPATWARNGSLLSFDPERPRVSRAAGIV
jgi:hypothetical protein